MAHYSPYNLLCLPFEIKEQVYTYALGCQLIKIEIADSDSASPATVRARGVQDHATITDSLSSHSYEAISFPLTPEGRQVITALQLGESQVRKQIWDFEGLESPIQGEDSVKPNLNLLGVCRQMYQETSAVFWSNAIFSFADAKAFETFSSKIPLPALKQIKHLHIRMRPFLNETEAWEKAFRGKMPKLRLSLVQNIVQRRTSPRRINAFPNLQSLHITLYCQEYSMDWNLVTSVWLLPLLPLLEIRAKHLPHIQFTAGRKRTDAEFLIGDRPLTFLVDAQLQIRESHFIPCYHLQRQLENAVSTMIDNEKAKDFYERIWAEWFITMLELKSREDEKRKRRGEKVYDAKYTIFGEYLHPIRSKRTKEDFLQFAGWILRALLRV